MIEHEPDANHDSKISMIIFAIKSPYNLRLLYNEFTSQYHCINIFSIKQVCISTDMNVKFQELADFRNISVKIAKNPIQKRHSYVLETGKYFR